MLGGVHAPVHSPDIVLCEPIHPDVIKDDDMITEAVVPDASVAIVLPTPGFRKFSWPREDWMVGDDPSLNTVVEELPGWSLWSAGGLPVVLPSPPIVLDSSDDSVAVQWDRPGRSCVADPSREGRSRDNSWLQCNRLFNNRGTASPTQPQSVGGNLKPTSDTYFDIH